MRRTICFTVCDGCGIETETNLNEAPEDWITLVPVEPGQMMVKINESTKRVTFCDKCKSSFAKLIGDECDVLTIDPKRLTWDQRVPTARELGLWLESLPASEFATGLLAITDALRERESEAASDEA